MLTTAKNWQQVGSATECGGYEQLQPGGLRRLERRGQIIQVSQGRAWITFNGEDHILESGEVLQLSHGDDHALVSGLGSSHLAFTVR